MAKQHFCSNTLTHFCACLVATQRIAAAKHTVARSLEPASVAHQARFARAAASGEPTAASALLAVAALQHASMHCYYAPSGARAQIVDASVGAREGESAEQQLTPGAESAATAGFPATACRACSGLRLSQLEISIAAAAARFVSPQGTSCASTTCFTRKAAPALHHCRRGRRIWSDAVRCCALLLELCGRRVSQRRRGHGRLHGRVQDYCVPPLLPGQGEGVEVKEGHHARGLGVPAQARVRLRVIGIDMSCSWWPSFVEGAGRRQTSEPQL